MSIGHRYVYFLDGTYLLSELERPMLENAVLPFELNDDSINVAAGYIRWSDKMQDDGHSLVIQEKEVVAKAKNENFQVVVMFVEQATSAYHKRAGKRKKMTEMKNYILSNAYVNTVIFYDESRVTRQIDDFTLEFINPIRSEKPNFKIFSTKFDGEWSENNPLIQIKFAYDFQESQKKAQRAYDYHKTTIHSKHPHRPGSRHPYGYSMSTIKNGAIETNENAEIVQLIFYLYSYGYSEKKIAHLLNEADIPAPSIDSSWSDSSIRYILNNPWYIGDLVWFARMSFENSKKKTIRETPLFSDHHKPLISASLWETTQFFRNKKKNKDRMDSPFILRDLVHCSSCGNKLTVKNMTPSGSTKNYMYYRCAVCKNKMPDEVLHQMVTEDFSKRWSRELKHHKTQFIKVTSGWEKVLREKIKELNDLIEKYRYQLSCLTAEHEYYEDILESFNYEIKNLEQKSLDYKETLEKIDTLLGDEKHLEILGRFNQDLSKYTNEEKRSIFLLAIKKIDIDFTTNYLISIDYHLTPYVEMESFIDSIIEEKSGKTVV